MKDIPAKIGSIPTESHIELCELNAGWIIQSKDFDGVVIDIEWLKEHIDEDEQVFALPAQKAASILNTHFGNSEWNGVRLLYLFPE